jgi:O-antigen/teichoic acid export membrane protein
MTTAAQLPTGQSQPAQTAGGNRSIYTRVFQASAIYSIATFAPLAASMITLPIYSRFLHPSDYGVLELLDATRTVIAMIVGARFSESLLYFYARAESDAERHASACTVVYGSLLLGLAAAILGWILSPALSKAVFQSSGYVVHLRLVCATFGLCLPIEAVMAWLRALDRAGGYVWLALSRLVLTVAATAIFVIPLKMHVVGMLVGTLVATVLIAVYGISMFFRANSLSFNAHLFLAQLRFGFLLTATGTALFVIHFGDRFFLERYQSLTQVGLYGLAYKCGMVVSIVQAAFSQYWFSQVYNILDHADKVERFRRVHAYLIMTLSYLAVLISVSAGFLFHIALPPEYRAAAAFVPWIALTYVLRAHGDYFRSALYVEGRPGTDTRINAVAAVVCVGLYATMIPRLGVAGAIGATAGAFLVAAILAWWSVARTKLYTVEAGRIVRVCLITVLMATAPLFLHVSDLRIQLLIAVAGAAAFPIALCVSRALTHQEIESVKGIVIGSLRSAIRWA